MKRLLAFIFCAICGIASAQQTNRFPLNRAFLQSDLNGNGKKATNFGTLKATNFVDAATGLPLSTGSQTNDLTKQPASPNLTNWSTLTTQAMASVSQLNGASNALAFRAITNFGIGTNVTLSDRLITGTNSVYVRGFYPDTQANGNYFYARVDSGVAIRTNASGYGMADDTNNVLGFGTNAFLIVNSTNGAVLTWDANILYFVSGVAGSTWVDNNSGGSYPLVISGFGQYYPSLIAGRIEGNLAGGTNLNGSTIQPGTIQSAAFAAGAIDSVLTNINGNVTATGDGTFTNVYGNAATLRGLPVGGTAIWKNLPLPMFIFTTYNVDHVVANGGPHAQTVTNIIALTAAKGITAALARHGLPSYMHLDAGWPYATRDANGLIQWNTNKFPTGIPRLSTYCHASNWLLGGSLYYSDKDHPTSGGVFEPVMTASTMYRDINQYRNGLFFDWIRASDGNGNNTASYQNEFAIGLAYAVTYPNNLPAGNTNKQGLIIDMATHDNIGANIGYYVNSRWSDQGVGSGNPGVKAMAQLRASERGDGTTNGATPTDHQSGKGHLIGHCLLTDVYDGVGGLTFDDYRTPFACEAIKPAEVVWGFTTNWTATYLQHMTNDSWLAIMADPLCLPGSIIYDNGSSSTLEAARSLTNGCFAVLLRNDGASASNMVATFSQIHSPADWAPMGSTIGQWAMNSGPYQVDHVFGLTNVSTAAYGSVTFTVAAGTSELLMFTPVGINGTNIAGTLTNSTTGNASTASLALTSGALTAATGLTNGIIPSARYAGAGVNSVKLGSAAAAGGNSISIGASADSSGSNSIAIGYGALGQVQSATAIGDAANAAYTNSTAIGQNSQTTQTNQIQLGVSSGTVVIPGTLNTLTNPVSVSNQTFAAGVRIGTNGNIDASGSISGALNASQLASGLIPKAQAGSITNTTDTKVIGTAPAIGDILQYDGSNWTNRPIHGYTLDLFDGGNNSMAANTSYYYGKMSSRLINTVYGIAQIDIPKSGTIKRVQYKDDISGTLASGEVVNFYIEVNNATDVFNWAFAMTALFTNNVVTGSQAVVAGDTIVFKVATPATWATPATSVRLAAQVYIE